VTPSNDRFLRALRREPVDATPVWLMRQAGRYLPEYRATRAKAGSFMGLATNPDLACEVTLQPLARFDLDAAILFSDILTIPDAMGLGLSFAEGEGPRFARPVRSAADIARAAAADLGPELRCGVGAVAPIPPELDNRGPRIGAPRPPPEIGAQGKPDGEGRPPSLDAFHRNAAPMAVEDVFDDGQSKTRAGAIAALLALNAIEPFRQPGQGVARHAGA